MSFAHSHCPAPCPTGSKNRSTLWALGDQHDLVCPLVPSLTVSPGLPSHTLLPSAPQPSSPPAPGHLLTKEVRPLTAQHLPHGGDPKTFAQGGHEWTDGSCDKMDSDVGQHPSCHTPSESAPLPGCESSATSTPLSHRAAAVLRCTSPAQGPPPLEDHDTLPTQMWAMAMRVTRATSTHKTRARPVSYPHPPYCHKVGADTPCYSGKAKFTVRTCRGHIAGFQPKLLWLQGQCSSH